MWIEEKAVLLAQIHTKRIESEYMQIKIDVILVYFAVSF